MITESKQTHPPPPLSKILQTVGAQLHSFALRYINGRIILRHSRKEKYKSTARDEQVSRKLDKVRREGRKFVWFGRGHICFMPGYDFCVRLESEDINARTNVCDSEPSSRTRGSDRISCPSLRPSRLAPARTPSAPSQPRRLAFGQVINLQGGSVTIASNKPPLLSGPWVISKVHKSKIRPSTLYCAAALRIPGFVSIEKKEYCKRWDGDQGDSNLCHAFVCRQCRSRKLGLQNVRPSLTKDMSFGLVLFEYTYIQHASGSNEWVVY